MPDQTQYKLLPVDHDPWSGASDEGVAFDTTNYALHLTEQDKQEAAQRAAMEAAAQAQANPVTPQRAFLQGLSPDVSDEDWARDLKDSLAKEGASPLTSALAKTLGIGEREISRFLGAPKQAYELGQRQDSLGLLDPALRKDAQAGISGDSANLALGLLDASSPFGRPAGSLGIFGGRGAETASGLDLTAAQLKLAAGRDPAAIWQQHGWHQDIDGKWKFEIPDQDAKLHPEATAENLTPGHEYRLGDVLQHPAFFAAYPEAADWGVGFNAGRSNGVFQHRQDGTPPSIQLNPGLDRDKQLSTLLHEVQHGVQYREDFAKGGAASELPPDVQQTVQKILPEYNKLWEMPEHTPAEAARFTQLSSLLRRYDEFNNQAYERYRQGAGEVESRNVQTRQLLSDADRRATPPDMTADVPLQQRRVSMVPDVGPQSAVPPVPQAPLPSGWHPDAHAVLQQEHDFLAQHLPADSQTLANLQLAMKEGPEHQAQLSDTHLGAAQAAQQAHEAAMPPPLTDTHHQMLQELQANRREVTRDGETFWEAPEPEVGYTRSEAEALQNHGYHLITDRSVSPIQRSWVWSKDLPDPQAPNPKVHLGQFQQEANKDLQTEEMQTTPQSRLDSSLKAFPSPDPVFHGHLTSLLAKGDMEAPEFLQQLYAGKGLEPQGMHLGNGLLDMSSVLGSKSNPAGYIQRTFNVPGNSVEHEFFELNDKRQGKGLGKELLGSQIGLYQKLGLDKVGLYANIDVGGYAWGKYGFKPTQQAWDHLRGQINKSELMQQLPDDLAQEVYNHTSKGDPTGLWHLSDLKAPVETPEGVLPLGKALLLGRRWRGTLDLKDPTSMERFNAYTQGKKKE